MRKRSQSTLDPLHQPVEDAVFFTKGKEHFAAIQYNSFEVGPFEVRLHPRDEVTPEGAVVAESYGEMLTRANGILDAMFDKEFERLLNKHLDRLERVGEVASQRKRR